MHPPPSPFTPDNSADYAACLGQVVAAGADSRGGGIGGAGAVARTGWGMWWQDARTD